VYTLLKDLRFTIRQLRKNPGFALTAALTLALGIGASTSIFSLVNAVLLRPLPFPQPERLMSLQHESHASGAVTQEPLSYPDFFDWRAQNHSFAAMASYRDNGHTLTGAGYAQNISGETVSADFFRVLRVQPVLGRDFVRADEQPGQRVAMLSHELWESAFGGRPEVVGRTITLDGKPYTVAGVMPAGFAFPVQNPGPAVWVTLAADALDPDSNNPPTRQRGADMLSVIARLKPGVTVAQARAEMSTIDRHLAAQYPDTDKHFTSAEVKPELEALVGDARPALRTLFAAVCFLLLIACANVAGLLLARASRRQAEIALRAALGASRAEIIRQILVESVTLSLLGGLLGLAFSTLFLKAMLQFVPQNLPRLDAIPVDAAVLGFTIAASVITGVLFGVLPAWRMSKLDPSLAMREGARSVTSGRGQHRLHSALVIAETALSLILLIGSGLFIHSFVRVLNIDPGFDRHNVLIAGLNYPDGKNHAENVTRFYDVLLPRLAALPGVKSVAAGWPLPFSGGGLGVSFDVEGRPQPPGESFDSRTTVITPNFFHTLGIPVLRGREFTAADASSAPPVVIVNESFARKFFPGQDPIGKHIKPGLNDGVHFPAMREIVGVVGDVKLRSLTDDAPPTFYLPLAQMGIVSPNLVIRSQGDPAALIPEVRSQVNALDHTIPLFDAHTMEDALSDAASQPRFSMALLTAFAAMALLLAAVGLYAVLSYMVAQRTNEIGLRLALGAQRGDVLQLILERGLILAGIGIVVGLAASSALTHFVSSLLYGVRAFDWPTYVVVTAVFLAISLIASAAPAMRAANVDPGTTLREQ